MIVVDDLRGAWEIHLKVFVKFIQDTVGDNMRDLLYQTVMSARYDCSPDGSFQNIHASRYFTDVASLNCVITQFLDYDKPQR